MNHPLPDMMSASVAKIKEMVDANTVIGDPIQTPEGVTIIPVSKVKVGYAGGGSDFAPKGYPTNKANAFGGGFCFFGNPADTFKITCAVLAQRANVILRQITAFIHISADLAAPSRTLGRGGFRLDIALII